MHRAAAVYEVILAFGLVSPQFAHWLNLALIGSILMFGCTNEENGGSQTKWPKGSGLVLSSVLHVRPRIKITER